MKLHLLTHRKYAQISQDKEKEDKSEIGLNQRISLRIQKKKQNRDTDKHKDIKTQKITIKCMKCEKEFLSNGSLRKHTKRCHSLDVEKQKAIEKPKTENEPEDAKKKSRTKSSRTDKSPPRKAIISKSSKTKEKSSVDGNTIKPKKKHIPNNQTSGETKVEKKYKCSQCQAKFAFKSNYMKHLEKHSEVEDARPVSKPEKKYKCSLCPAKFAFQSNFIKHKATHTPTKKSNGSKPAKKFKCSECPARFAFKSNFLKHELIHNPNAVYTKPPKKYDCTECSAKFAFKSNLVRHEALHNPKSNSSRPKQEKKFACTECSAKFAFRSNLRKHERTHNSDNSNVDKPVKKYKCSKCPAKFSFKSNLSKHKATHSSSETSSRPEKKYKCALCPAKFSINTNLWKHRLNYHPESNPTDSQMSPERSRAVQGAAKISRKDKPFECVHCTAVFSFESNLKKHVRNYHFNMEDNQNHETSDKPEDSKKDSQTQKIPCPHCTTTFFSKKNLSKHTARYHSKLEEGHNYTGTSNTTKCPLCETDLEVKSNLVRHLKQFHFGDTEKYISVKYFNASNLRESLFEMYNLRKYRKRLHAEGITKKSVRCPLCQNSYNKKSVLFQHFRNEHDIALQDEYITFSSEAEFKKWKVRTEEEARCNYRIRHSVLYPDYKKVIFRCSRSGCYASKTGIERQRKLKKSGSKKINGLCPAEIDVKVIKKTGLVYVHYQSTHVGHANELKYLDLNDGERELIIKNITAGVTVNSLLQKFCIENNANPQETRKRLHLLNKNEIRNVAKCAGLYNPTSKVRFKEDPITAQEWVIANSQSVLYCKWKGEFDERFPYLGDDDFVLIIMTNSQYEKLNRFGNNILYFDGNHGVNDSDFQLSILLVLNEMEKQFPCTFMFSNRNDEHAYNVLIECLREKVPSLQPEIIMTDMTDSFYDVWAQTMPEPKFRLYCTWHVLRDWKANLMKIHTLELRKQVSKTLEILLHTTDDNHFMEELKEFMEHTFDCDDFQRYFMEEYLVKRPPKHWAQCYRQTISVNVNLSLKLFHKNMKYHVYGGNKVKQLDEALRRLDKYLVEKEHEDILLQEGCIPATNKIRVIRKRHSQVENVRVENIECVEENEVWFITSCMPIKKSKNEDAPEDDVLTMYSVERTYTDCKTNNCVLKCEDCDACLHNFKCSCEDYAERGNMCIHIHILCIYLKANAPEESNGFASEEERDEISTEETEDTLTEEESAVIDSEEEPSEIKKEELTDGDSGDDYSFTLSVTEISPVCSPKREDVTDFSSLTNRIKSESMEFDHSNMLEESVDDVEAKFAEIFKEIRQNPDEKLKYLNMLRQTAVALNELNSS